MFGAISVDTISDSTPLRRGFSFALYRHGAGLFFLPDSVSATHKRLQRLFCRPCNYTATETKPFTELCSGFSVNLTHSSAHNTIDTQAAYTPPAQHRRAYRQAQHLHRYQIPPQRRTLHSSSQPPYYNKVYKSAAARSVMNSCQTVQHIADHASPAVQSSGRSAAGGAESLTATAVSLFGLSPDSQ